MIDLDVLRALIRDEDEAVFTDEALEAAVLAAGDSLLRAAGVAFRSLAAEYATKGKSVKTDDLAIDIRSRGKDLNEVADSFFKDANAQDAAVSELNIVALPPRRSGGSVRPEATPWPIRGWY